VEALDPKTRLLLFKLINADILDNVNGCVSTGKEAVIFHATGGRYGPVAGGAAGGGSDRKLTSLSLFPAPPR
jgi:serine/threonine-protein kinase RIO1